MKSAWQALKLELPPMARLAGPVVLSELGWMTMGMVDNIMVGHVSPAAMGAVSIGGILFYTVAVIGTAAIERQFHIGLRDGGSAAVKNG